MLLSERACNGAWFVRSASGQEAIALAVTRNSESASLPANGNSKSWTGGLGQPLYGHPPIRRLTASSENGFFHLSEHRLT